MCTARESATSHRASIWIVLRTSSRELATTARLHDHSMVRTQNAPALLWADGNPLTEYQKEYYKKQLMRQRARRAVQQTAGEAKEYTTAEGLKAFGITHAPNEASTTSKNDFHPHKSKTVIVGAPWHDPMPPREFTAKSVYSDTYFKKAFSKPFDPDSNVNIARAKYDSKQNPWFGKSLAAVDYPDWGHPHQAPLADKTRPLGPTLPFTATTTNKADFVVPGKRAARYHKPKHEAVPSATLTNATMYRADLEWSGGAARAPPCAVGYLAEGPSLETACCQAAESHGEQLVQDLQAAAAQQQPSGSAKQKAGSKGAAGASSAACTNILTGKRMVKEIAQQVPGAPYAAGSSTKPQTTYQRFCSTALVQ